MKNVKKALSLLLAIMILVGTFMPVFAAEEANKTIITIHKIVMPKEDLEKHKDEDKEPKYNGSQIQDINGYFGEKAKEVEGVAFDIYMQVDNQEEGAVQNTDPILGGLADEDAGKFYKKINKTPLITSGNNKGVDTEALDRGTYIIVENKEASKYQGEHKELLAESKAVPVKIELPMTKPDGTGLFNTEDKLHIYPKNTEEKPETDKTVGDLENKYESTEIGKTVTWFLQATAPTDIGAYKVFKMTDEFDKSLSYKGSVKVKYGNGTDFQAYTELTKEEDYKLTEPEVNQKGGKLIIELTAKGISKLKSKDKVVASVDTIINEDVIMGLEIPNDFKLEYGHNPDNTGETEKIPEDKQPKVITGGKRFKKTNEETPLADAIFQLYDDQKEIKWTEDLLKANDVAIKAGQFAINGEDNKFTATSESNMPSKDQNIYLRSKDDGLFEIKGLEFSNWKKQKWDAAKNMLDDTETITHSWNLKEVKAPEGYALLEDQIEFTVDKNSYFNNPTKVEQTPSDPQVIKNKKVTIPQTGGIGTVIFGVVGIALMAGAVVAMKKRNEEAHE